MYLKILHSVHISEPRSNITATNYLPIGGDSTYMNKVLTGHETVEINGFPINKCKEMKNVKPCRDLVHAS